MLKKYLIVLSLILSSVLVPSLSFACYLTGIVVQVLSYDDSYTTTSGYIYFRPNPLAAYVYYTYTNDDDMISNAIAYMDSGRTVTIDGNVTCPAVPAAGGFGYVGALNYMW